MEGAMATWAACPLRLRPVCIPLSTTARSSNQCHSLESKMSLREGKVDIYERIVGRYVNQGSQSWFATRGRSEGEERPLTAGHAQDSHLDTSSVRRREVLGKAILLLVSAVAFSAAAADEQFALYEDTEYKFSLLVPQEWTKGEGTTGPRRVMAFFPDNDTSANVNIIITGLGADYTGLGSLGSADVFAENLVNSLDRAWQRPKGQAAKLIDSKSENGMYYVEYTIQKPGEAKRHLLSVVGVASNGWINQLFTVTGQYWEGDDEKYKESLQKVVSSFRLI